jgi:sulfoxide reductase heme-binding subunit YedZ
MSLAGALKSGYAKPVVFLVCLIPLASLIWDAFNDGLGANPVETLTFATGDWTLRFLLITLTISPLRLWSGQAAWLRFRRMLGLYAFFYGCCHFLIWFVADHSLDVAEMIEDVFDRPFITVGFSALVLMIPLAITSNQAMIRRLGRRWRSLHQLVYLIVGLGALHYIWLVKADYLEPNIYAIIAVILLLQRLGSVKRLFSRTSSVAR